MTTVIALQRIAFMWPTLLTLAVFGEAYEQYKETTPAFFSRVGGSGDCVEARRSLAAMASRHDNSSKT
jgi:hypothetical protein